MILIHFSAGNLKTDTEIEELLESGNFAVFTQGVSHSFIYITTITYSECMKNNDKNFKWL